MFFDTVLHDPVAVELLIKVVGANNCLFGTEWPGLGSVIDNDSGRSMDNLAPDIQKLSWLSDDEIEAILWKNTTDLYNLGDILSII
jgi:4-oxalmesaconate hydratase